MQGNKLKFYNPTIEHNDCPFVTHLVSKDWDFTNNDESVDFFITMQKYYIKHLSSKDRYVSVQIRQNAVDNFSNLENFNKTQSILWPEQELRDMGVKFSHDNYVAVLDRGKPKTIVVISSGGWPESLYKNGVSHYGAWMFHEFPDYNIISLVEDVGRSFRNPVLYASFLYAGLNDELNSIEKVADFITEIMPDTEYHIVSDCKNGHSGSILAYYLNATRVLLQSGMSTCDLGDLFSRYYNENDEIPLTAYFGNFSIEFGIRVSTLCGDIPLHLRTVNDIAKSMPNTEFTYMHHADDLHFRSYIDGIDGDIENIKKSAVERSPYTFADHHITLELRRNGTFTNYFNL